MTKKSRKDKFNPLDKGVYVGESSRSLYERTKEHMDDAKKDAPESHIRKHWIECHPEMVEMPVFKFKIVKSFRDSLSRQVAEGVRIDLRVGVMNSKTVYSRNRLPRQEVEKPEWERSEEERRRKMKEWREKEIWEKTQEKMKEVAGDALRDETEEMMREQWRQQPARRMREEDQCEEQQEKPPRKKRRGAYEGEKTGEFQNLERTRLTEQTDSQVPKFVRIKSRQDCN